MGTDRFAELESSLLGGVASFDLLALLELLLLLELGVDGGPLVLVLYHRRQYPLLLLNLLLHFDWFWFLSSFVFALLPLETHFANFSIAMEQTQNQMGLFYWLLG